jgi:predicted O-methyltransferase YrrM
VKFEQVAEIVKGVAFIDPRNARHLYDLIIREQLTNILELGIAHGTATCYMAAALDELGKGKITSVDLIEAKGRYEPSPEEQLAKANLAHLVQIVRMQTGYSWFLHDEIRRLTTDGFCRPEYNLCVIDGSKNWTIDGGAFFMVDKMLKENGWMIFDDYLWTYAEAARHRAATDGITHRELSEEELNVPHVKEIVELLVMQHPNYARVLVYPDDNWAMAQKVISEDKTYSIQYIETNRDVLVDLKRRVSTFLRKHLRHTTRPTWGRSGPK